MTVNNRDEILQQIEEIKSLLDKIYSEYPKEELNHHTIYVPVPTDAPISKLNRISPYAPVIEESQWPRVQEGESYYDDDYYEDDYDDYYDKEGTGDSKSAEEDQEKPLLKHVFSIDLRTIPKIKNAFKDNINTLSFFISSLWDNEAYEPGNGETYVMLHEVTEGEFLPEELKDDEELEDLTETYFDFVELEIPEVLMWSYDDWANIEIEDYDPESSAEHKLIIDTYNIRENYDVEEWDKFPVTAMRDKVFNLPAYVGGSPIWLQSAEYTGFFIMQFSEAFVDINLGDSGEMYVFADTAFWQCY